MDQIARLLAERLLRSGIIEEDALEWCVYGIERRLVTFLTWLVLLGVGSAWFGPVRSLLFTACLLFIRSRTNGYHAPSYGICLVLSLLMELGCLWGAEWLPQTAALVLLILADLVIWVFAPSNDSRIHLNSEEFFLMRESARRRLLALNGLYLLLALNRVLSNCVAAALTADAISLFVAKKDRISIWKTEVSSMKKEIKQLIQGYVQGMVNRDMERRTPGCIGWYYQPARPVQKNKEDEKV